MDGTTQAALGSDAIAPDTRGENFFDQDGSLRDLLRVYLEPALYAHLEPHLSRMGRLAANELDVWAHQADRHPPVLHHRDRFGRDIQSIEFHPGYRELERVAYGEFGMHVMSHKAGVLGWNAPFPTVAKHAFTYLFNQAEFGLGCPINVTDSGILLLRRYGSEEIRERYLPLIMTQEMDRLWQGGQFMTEKEGGSDVGRATTVAVREGDHWRLHGEKWFCSNADAGLIQVLARPEGAGPGTRGLGLFVMPRDLEDGSRNAYRIVRLKDKLGTRSMASGEVKLEGAVAYAMGRLDRGFVQMADMVNWSRLSNGVKSTALMRRSVHDALAVARGRVVFGSRIVDLPLARRQLLKLILPTEMALSMAMATADALDRAGDTTETRQGGSQEAQALLRMLTPVLKYRATRDARKVTGDALEMRGGIGYVEEFVNPRLLRDAHLGSIWEGTGNIIALDAITRSVGRHACQSALGAALHAKLDDAASVPAAFRNRLKAHVDRAITFAETVAATPEREADARRATSLLYFASAAALMAWEADRIHALTGDARRLLLARLVIDHRLAPADPYAAADTVFEDRAAGVLLGDAPLSMAEAAKMVAG